MAHLHKQHFYQSELCLNISISVTMHDNHVVKVRWHDDSISDKNKGNKGLEGLNKHATCISKLRDTRLHQKHLPYN